MGILFINSYCIFPKLYDRMKKQGDELMHIESNISLLLGDTAVSDIFIDEFLTEAEGDFVKVYLYCLFLL